MYGEFGAMRFPRQHHLGQHLIHERFGLATTPFGMEDEDTFIYLNGGRPTRSAFDPAAADFVLPEGERGADAGRDPARTRCSRSSTSSAQPGGWQQIVERYDRYSLLGWLVERGVSEQALWLLGPLFNLEGRFHFSLVEWFTPLARGRVRRPRVHRRRRGHARRGVRPALLPDTRLGAEVHAVEQGADGVVVRYRDAVGFEGVVEGDECILTVPFVLLRHMEITGLDVDKWFTIRNVYYGRAHKIFMQFSRRWWSEDYAITHGVTVTDLAIRNVVYTPAGQDPSTGKGVIIASYAWEQDSMAYSMLDERQRITQALEDLAQDPPGGARDVRVRGLARLGAGPPRRRHRAAVPAVRDDRPVLRRHRRGRSAGSGSRTTPATAARGAGSRAPSRPP